MESERERTACVVKLPWRRLRGLARWLGRPSRWVLGTAATLFVLLAVIDLLADEPLRRQMEQKLNARLHGYTVRILAADFHVLGCGLDLKDELTVKNKRIEGYVKPLFRELDVYEEHQDRHKPAIRRLYERLVDGASKVLGNWPRDEVATKAKLSGPIENPKANSLEIIVGLIQNAFFEAILPGFEQQLKRWRSGSAARETRRS